ncbi:MAG: hypothetical protein Q8P86_03230 [bacterium]|nr:hypothetical protein [bacterium]
MKTIVPLLVWTGAVWLNWRFDRNGRTVAKHWRLLILLANAVAVFTVAYSLLSPR